MRATGVSVSVSWVLIVACLSLVWVRPTLGQTPSLAREATVLSPVSVPNSVDVMQQGQEVYIRSGSSSEPVALKAFWFMAPLPSVGGDQAASGPAESFTRPHSEDVAAPVTGGPSPMARPAVVLLHGCSGMYDRHGKVAARYRDYITLLHGLGMHALLLDSLTPRGEKELCTQKYDARAITQHHRRQDALAALAWLATQPGVNAQKLGLLGWSHGGSAVLASTNEKEAEVLKAPVRAAFAVAYYPGCGPERRRGYLAQIPILMLLGANDDWTRAQPCEQLAQEAHGMRPEVVSYPEAFHGFDGRGPVILRQDVPNGAYPGRGVHVGGHPSAREQSFKKLQEFLLQRL